MTERHDRIVIVATGPSLRGADLAALERLEGVFTIAVKQAILGLAADAWITVDPNPRARALMADPRPGTCYWAAVPADYGTPGARLEAHSAPAEAHVRFLRRIAADTPDRVRYTLAEEPDAIHTGNSAWGALGLAYHMRPRKIGFLGLDATQDAHGIGTGAPRGSLGHLPRLFASAASQLVARNISVFNGSKRSRVDCFRRGTAEELMKWIQD